MAADEYVEKPRAQDLPWEVNWSFVRLQIDSPIVGRLLKGVVT